MQRFPPSSFSSTAMCVRLLKEMGVTAVLNAAQGSMSDWNYVNTKESYYQGTGLAFKGIQAIDLKHYPINVHFKEASDFIDSVIRQKGTFEHTHTHTHT